MQLSTKDRAAVLQIAAETIVTELKAEIAIDELALLPIETAAVLLGLSVKQTGRILPVIEIGPRTRRVTVAAYKTALAERTRKPSAA